tara:strand:+ start:228 stop:656 length:429 start_codon:yes stop_codon:yes gene_type:complete
MNKSDLKQLIKPLVKECIHEVLIEEGLLSNVVAEVAKGMQGNIITEQQQIAPSETGINEAMRDKVEADRKKVMERRQELMQAVGADAYNGVDLFEGTSAMTARQAGHSEPSRGTVDLGDPNDAGVDISSLIGGASKMWHALK